MRVAMETLGLDQLTIVYPGDQAYEFDAAIDVKPLPAVRESLGGQALE